MKAILTGHTQGLGAALAAELLARGIPVLGLARRHAEAADGCPAALRQVALDLADPAALTRWLAGDTLRAYLAGCKSVLLINNAGTLQPVGPLAQQDPGAIAAAITLNVAAPLMLAGAVAAASPAAAERRIVHISSGAACNAYPGWSVYCASKAALDQHARAVALDGTAGLRICSLAPGVIDTAMQDSIRASTLEQFPLRAKFEELKRSGALSEPADCARHLLDYLLSEQFGSVPTADLRHLPAPLTR